MDAEETSRRPGRRAATVVAVATLVVVVGAGALYALANPRRYQAEARLAVFPSESDADAQASYYETLSSGQIVETIAELLGTRLGGDAGPGTSVDAHVVANTSVVVIRAGDDDADGAEAAADSGLAVALAYVDDLRIPFVAVEVADARGTAEPTGIPAPAVIALAGFAAIVAAVGAANATAGLALALRRSAETEG
jgi:hypothetical protein